VAIRSTSIPNNTNAIVYTAVLLFGRSDTIRIDMSTTLKAHSYDLTMIRDSLGIGYSVTNDMGDDIFHSVLVSGTGNVVDITITNNESTVMSVFTTELLSKGLDNCVYI